MTFDATSFYNNLEVKNITDRMSPEELRAAKSGGYLRAFAAIMAVIMKDSVKDLVNTANGLGKNPDIGQTTDLSAKSQEVTMFLNAVGQVIKSLGEAEASLARKQ